MFWWPTTSSISLSFIYGSQSITETTMRPERATKLHAHAIAQNDPASTGCYSGTVAPQIVLGDHSLARISILDRRNLAMVLISCALLSLSGCDRRAQNKWSAQLFRAAGEGDLRKGLESGASVVELPDGILVLHHSVSIPPAASIIEIRGHSRGTTVRLAPDFSGKAAFVADRVSRVVFRSFILEGNRTDLHSDRYLPPDGTSFANYYDENGVAISNSQDVTVADVVFKNIRSFPLLVTASARVKITGVTIDNSGSLGPNGRNNTTGGILLEEGVRDFLVERTRIRNVLGNAIWTHSNSGSRRNADGIIQGNDIADVGRDAIQVGHATRTSVAHNRGDRIGFPALYVDAEHQGTPVALDTAGNVDQSVYADNIFSNVDGQCIDLDGFHAGEVTGNSCTNNNSVGCTSVGNACLRGATPRVMCK